MKILFIAFIFAVFVFANIDGYSYAKKEVLKDATANGLFLSYLKRQSKDLRRTIDTFEEMQQKQDFTSAKDKFWLDGKIGGEFNRCCICPSRKCHCCRRTGIGFCCDFIENNVATENDSNEEE
uniref:Uncharacterized protein n=1 Tax=Panagrolaimus davidi TaxID=227884 RepID=A0A914QZS6_9BILA